MSSFTTSRFPTFSVSRAGLGDAEALSTDPAQLVESPDETLMALVQIGDLDALALLFRRFAPSRGSARSWIFQVTYTQALIRRRQLKTHGFYASPITDKTFENSPSSIKGTHYDDTVEGFFGRNGWRSVWDSLTECQRETLRLHFYEGCTFTEIVEKVGQSYVNIRHHYYRGLEKLRKHAEENDLNWP